MKRLISFFVIILLPFFSHSQSSGSDPFKRLFGDIPKQFTPTYKSAKRSQKPGFYQDIVTRNGLDFTRLSTRGQYTGITEYQGHGQHWIEFDTENGTYSVDIMREGHIHGVFEGDSLGAAKLARQPQYQALQVDNTVVVDIMLLYTPNIVNAYPDELTETLLAHLVNKANQAFVNSDINVQLRLVHTHFVDYRTGSNFQALDDLTAALNNDISDSSLSQVRVLRDEMGADIVAMIRTHDLIEREVCGVARFPNTETDVLVNISNVGISGGSNCIDTFTHEIGHNFGAGHQAVDGQSRGALDNSGALLIPGKFNTVMSSIGTGDANRNFKLNVFSNLDNQCGGRICGDAEFADNASTVEAFALQNANLREATIPLDNFSLPLKTFPDSDNDSVDDRFDAFPHLASETSDVDNDGIGDNSDAFVNDSTEFIDTDSDGIGNSADQDDDNDGVLDSLDDLPLDAQESVDSDGDGVGANRDALENDFREFLDNDGDGIGNRADPDDDNDGLPDFYQSQSLSDYDVLVVSADSNELLSFDASSGAFNEIVTTLPEGSFTFRSDLVVTQNQAQVFFIAQSDVYRLDRQTGEVSVLLDRSELFANFPEHLGLVDDERLVVTNSRFNFEIIEIFDLTSSGSVLTYQRFIEGVQRDLNILTSQRMMVTDRLNNRVDILSLTDSASELTLFADEFLEKPEYIDLTSTGFILVSTSENNVNSYRGTGAYRSQTVSGDQYGIDQIGCLVVGPQDILLICDPNNNRILAFDANSGQFISEIINDNGSSLARPVGVAFVAKANDPTPYVAGFDIDSDGVVNASDAFPRDPNESVDTDGDGIGNNEDTDDDNDGMPDSYENQYNFDPLDPSDATQDADDDGSSNLAEYTIGSNPRVSSQTELEQRNSGGSGGALQWWWLLLGTLLFGRRYFSN